MVYQEEFELNTGGHSEMNDLTDDVSGVVARSGIESGTVTVFNVGSTGATGSFDHASGCRRPPEAWHVAANIPFGM